MNSKLGRTQLRTEKTAAGNEPAADKTGSHGSDRGRGY